MYNYKTRKTSSRKRLSEVSTVDPNLYKFLNSKKSDQLVQWFDEVMPAGKGIGIWYVYDSSSRSFAKHLAVWNHFYMKNRDGSFTIYTNYRDDADPNGPKVQGMYSQDRVHKFNPMDTKGLIFKLYDDADIKKWLKKSGHILIFNSYDQWFKHSRMLAKTHLS